MPPDGREDRAAGASVYFEFISVGSNVKVTAIDAHTGIEASVVAPASLPQSALQQIAMRKLSYVLKRKRGET